MDSHNSSSDNYYTSERSDYDDYYSYGNSNNDSNNAKNTAQFLTTFGYYRTERKNNNNNNKKNKSNSQITSSSSILARILIVDDEPDVNFVLKIVLERVNGFKVDSFIDPESALQYFKSGLYDLAILDIKMPKMDGFELYQKRYAR
jgi:PleD family two-component response regulator